MERITVLNQLTLKNRRTQVNMTKVFQFLNGFDDVDIEQCLKMVGTIQLECTTTLCKRRMGKDVRMYFNSQRIDEQDKLSEEEVNAVMKYLKTCMKEMKGLEREIPSLFTLIGNHTHILTLFVLL